MFELMRVLNRVKDGRVVESGSHEELIRKASLSGEGGVYYEMWQKQLHDESETLSDTTQNIESSNSSAVEDKPERMDTQVIELADEEDTPSRNENTAVFPSTQQVEVIELELEEEEEDAIQTKEQQHAHNITATEEPEEIKSPSTSTSSSRPLSVSNTNKKKKKRKNTRQ
jgi:ATP-binding cassette subfamily B (MDR/TAP) protein 6